MAQPQKEQPCLKWLGLVRISSFGWNGQVTTLLIIEILGKIIGVLFHKNYILKILYQIKSIDAQNNAGNTGTATWTLVLKRDLGKKNKIIYFYVLSNNCKALKNGQKLSSFLMEEPKMHLKIDSL